MHYVSGLTGNIAGHTLSQNLPSIELQPGFARFHIIVSFAMRLHVRVQGILTSSKLASEKKFAYVYFAMRTMFFENNVQSRFFLDNEFV